MEFEKVRAIIVETLGCEAEQVTLEASLADDLGADSLAAVELVINLVLCAFFLFLVVYGVSFAKNGLTQTAPYLPIPMTVYYASIPSAAVLMLFYMVQIVAEQVLSLFRKEDRA